MGEINAGLIILRVASLGRDAHERDGASLRSSVAAATPSQQHYNLALKTQRVVSSFSILHAASLLKALPAAPAPPPQQLRSSVAAAAAGDGVVPRR